MARQPASERLTALAKAATEAFGRLGYRGTRTADVAAKAGMSAGSVFTYVESKEALFHLVFLYCLRLLPESPDLPLPAPAPGETAALFAQALQGTPVSSRLGKALAEDDPADVAEELHGIVEEIYSTIERAWPLLAVVERCAAEVPELETLWFAEGRVGIYADLAEYLRRRAASGRLRPMPDASFASRVLGEMVSWSAWHRREGYDGKLYDDQTARRTTIEFICAALVPATAIPKTDHTDHSERQVALQLPHRASREDASWTERVRTTHLATCGYRTPTATGPSLSSAQPSRLAGSLPRNSTSDPARPSMPAPAKN
jgi:AcrR family transcriptional regulator